MIWEMPGHCDNMGLDLHKNQFSGLMLLWLKSVMRTVQVRQPLGLPSVSISRCCFNKSLQTQRFTNLTMHPLKYSARWKSKMDPYEANTEAPLLDILKASRWHLRSVPHSCVSIFRETAPASASSFMSLQLNLLPPSYWVLSNDMEPCWVNPK